jgi:hypothetical protein
VTKVYMLTGKIVPHYLKIVAIQIKGLMRMKQPSSREGETHEYWILHPIFIGVRMTEK